MRRVSGCACPFGPRVGNVRRGAIYSLTLLEAARLRDSQRRSALSQIIVNVRFESGVRRHLLLSIHASLYSQSPTD